MARHEIIEKLESFLQEHPVLDEECHIVYLMVEIRKVLEHENARDFPLLRFYCDWSVHTEKDRITQQIKDIVEEVFRSAKAQIENPVMARPMSPVMRFAYMENLKNEMSNFLVNRNLSTSILDEENWIKFISTFVQILENQPINNPTKDVILLSFTPAASGCVQGVIVFKKSINGYGHYNFANAY